MKKKSAYIIGVEAEEKIAALYQKNGYQIVASRYKTKFGEIDIIAQKNATLVFIEVKARNRPMHMELIGNKQRKRNCQAALMYIASEEADYSEARFDYAEIVNGEISQIIENAWEYEFDD